MWCGIYGWEPGRHGRSRRSSGGQSFHWSERDSNPGSKRSRRSHRYGDDDPWGFAEMGEQIGYDMAGVGERMWRDQRAAQLRQRRRARDARRAAREARWEARRAARHSCGKAGPWAYWWLVFPLAFWVLPALARSVGRIADGASGVAARAVELSPLTPIAELVARAMGVGVGDAYFIVAAALAVNGGALIWALRQTDANRRA